MEEPLRLLFTYDQFVAGSREKTGPRRGCGGLLLRGGANALSVSEIDLKAHLVAPPEVALAVDQDPGRNNHPVAASRVEGDKARRDALDRMDPEIVTVQEVVDLEEGRSGRLPEDEALGDPRVEQVGGRVTVRVAVFLNVAEAVLSQVAIDQTALAIADIVVVLVVDDVGIGKSRGPGRGPSQPPVARQESDGVEF